MKHPYKQIRMIPEFIKGEYYNKTEDEFDEINKTILRNIEKRNKLENNSMLRWLSGLKH